MLYQLGAATNASAHGETVQKFIAVITFIASGMRRQQDHPVDAPLVVSAPPPLASRAALPGSRCPGLAAITLPLLLPAAAHPAIELMTPSLQLLRKLAPATSRWHCRMLTALHSRKRGPWSSLHDHRMTITWRYEARYPPRSGTRPALAR